MSGELHYLGQKALYPILCCMDTATLNGHDTRTHDKFLKIHMTCVSDTFRTRHGSMIGVSVLHIPINKVGSTKVSEHFKRQH